MLTTTLLLSAALTAAATPWWPFSWEKVSVHTFPGASSRFMNAAELNATSRFAFANVWGVNGTCVNATTGALFPAYCGNSHCNCNATAPTPEQQRFLPVGDVAARAVGGTQGG